MAQLTNNIYIILDLIGTFAFAISGAVAARQRGLDVFGIFALAFTTACGGGIIRDLCIGAIPPVGLTHFPYLLTALIAAIVSMVFYSWVNILTHPVLVFDAVGLSVFAIAGARKVLAFGFNYEVAILLGITTAVGGGVLRDVLLGRVPIILKREIYASAAMVGAGIVVLGTHLGYDIDIISIVALIFCFGMRFMSLHYHWNLPTFGTNKK
ncbi:trimeric intracellular cation channel family protein [Albibacterium indicum]|uniref:trimeric intracellular cation channel family protein n=1 Tax=Albibacterium indicum TaxID=2292082 RepID=UPI000E500D3D|nr:trimeric intracellular cation channel family protein [Pedobacter indicus]